MIIINNNKNFHDIVHLNIYYISCMPFTSGPCDILFHIDTLSLYRRDFEIKIDEFLVERFFIHT
jgi:hypothetical protein